MCVWGRESCLGTEELALGHPGPPALMAKEPELRSALSPNLQQLSSLLEPPHPRNAGVRSPSQEAESVGLCAEAPAAWPWVRGCLSLDLMPSGSKKG